MQVTVTGADLLRLRGLAPSILHHCIAGAASAGFVLAEDAVFEEGADVAQGGVFGALGEFGVL